MNIRTLRADEIECRVQQVKEKGCILLLYKDARCDMRILDETFGIMGWQRTHEVINGNLFCNVDIWDNVKNTWIRKQDVGTESNNDKQKGEASDSFKRACFNIGIGRELYTSPSIWINLEAGETYNKSGKLALDSKVKFEVKEVSYNENREISKLIIVDNKGKERFKYFEKKNNVSYMNKSTKEVAVTKEASETKEVSDVMVKALYKIATDKGYTENSVQKASIRDFKANVIDLSLDNYMILKTKFEKAKSKLEA